MSNRSVSAFLSNLIKAKPLYPAGLFCLSLISTLGNVMATTLLIPIISLLIGHSNQFAFNYGFGYVELANGLFDNLNLPRRLAALLISLSLIILLINIANYAVAVLGFRYFQHLSQEMKNQGLEMLAAVNLDYYRTNKTGEILLKLNREIDRAALAIQSICRILNISMTIAVLGGILAIISWQLTLVALLSLKMTSLVDSWLRNKTHKIRTLSSAATQKANRHMIEFLAGIRLIKSVGNEIQASSEISDSLTLKNREQLRTQSVFAAIKPVSEMGGVAVVLTLTIASYYLAAQSISAITPLLLIYLAVLSRLLPFISQFSNAKQQYLKTRASIETVASFLEPKNEPVADAGKLELTKLSTGIEFKAVSFAYPDQGQIILDQIDLWLPQGKAIALIGSPGTGNYIIADLLTRFYEPIGGKILVDGKELSEYSIRSLRQAIAVISRHTFIFNTSLADNIAYGLSHASAADIVAAAQKAKIYQFIQHLPAGLATQVGERGLKLSELQKQKISLARAFLRNPKIVILDEPWATGDRSLGDLADLQDVVKNLCDGRTTLIVTRQLKLAKLADQIAIFRQGRICEIGTHYQLLQQGKIYPQLYSMQFKLDRHSRQLKLAQKIARKLAQHNSSNLPTEVQTNFATLLNHLEIINQGWFKNDLQEEVLLDQSFQSAKNILASLKKYGDTLAENED